MTGAVPRAGASRPARGAATALAPADTPPPMALFAA